MSNGNDALRVAKQLRAMITASLGLRRLPLLLVLALTSSANASAPVSKKAPEPSSIEVKLETSRTQITPGLGTGVTAEIKNVSDSMIYIYEKTTTLTLPPEMESSGEIDGWYATFPTITHKAGEEYYNNQFALKPKDSYNVYWTTQNTNENPTKIRPLDALLAQLRFIFFPPGDYKLSVSVQYWTDPLRPKDDYRTITQSATVHVAAPELVVLLGASFGGLIAYIILPQARKKLISTVAVNEVTDLRTFFSRFTHELTGFFGAILLSAIITILLSRISETEFLLRVTVNDFWGAVAIGFVANYAGATALQSILKKFEANQQQKS